MADLYGGASHAAQAPGGDPATAGAGALRLSVEQRARLYEIQRAFAEVVELDQLLPIVTRESRALFGVESSAIMLLDASTDELYVPYVAERAPEVEPRFAAVRFPAAAGIAGAVLRDRTVALVPDVSRDPRWYPHVDGVTGMVTRSLLCAPLITRAGVVGVLSLRNKLADAFTPEDAALIGNLAESVAIAIENARRLGDAARKAAWLGERVDLFERDAAHRGQFDQIVGQSAIMRRVFALLASAASAPVTVLIVGETGTGKELAARAIHAGSPRRNRPFVAINCAAISETLLESELFGHRRGAFTGAVMDRKGLFEMADGGTVFLDEVGDMPLSMQVKLLRVLEQGEVLPVGETAPRRVDVRVISATHRDLPAEISAGRFRSDLYYRLNIFPIALPPLRERRDDIPLLIGHLLERTAAKFKKAIDRCSPEALTLLSAYPWPGNVRELQNELERAVALAPAGGCIDVRDLSPRVATSTNWRPSLPAGELPLRRAREIFEREYVAQVLERQGGNASRTARLLGISRMMLYRKLHAYGLRTRAQPALSP